MDNNILLENKEPIVYEYEFIPYKKIGSISLDKVDDKNFQPSCLPFLEEQVFNHVICRVLATDSPENKRRGLEKYVYIICDNKKVALTCMFNQFVENISQICDDIIINEIKNEKMKIAYSKKLGIIAYANQFKDESFYRVLAIHFTGKDAFNERINEIKNAYFLTKNEDYFDFGVNDYNNT